MAWASEANALVCNTVLKGVVSAVKGKELDGKYYEAASPVFELQVAGAAYRLAKWLDLIAAAGTSNGGERFFGPGIVIYGSKRNVLVELSSPEIMRYRAELLLVHY